jgi:hypothetical protein
MFGFTVVLPEASVVVNQGLVAPVPMVFKMSCPCLKDPSGPSALIALVAVVSPIAGDSMLPKDLPTFSVAVLYHVGILVVAMSFSVVKEFSPAILFSHLC